MRRGRRRIRRTEADAPSPPCRDSDGEGKAISAMGVGRGRSARHWAGVFLDYLRKSRRARMRSFGLPIAVRIAASSVGEGTKTETPSTTISERVFGVIGCQPSSDRYSKPDINSIINGASDHWPKTRDRNNGWADGGVGVTPNRSRTAATSRSLASTSTSPASGCSTPCKAAAALAMTHQSS